MARTEGPQKIPAKVAKGSSRKADRVVGGSERVAVSPERRVNLGGSTRYPARELTSDVALSELERMMARQHDAPRDHLDVIRQWLLSTGHEVTDRGPISSDAAALLVVAPAGTQIIQARVPVRQVEQLTEDIEILGLADKSEAIREGLKLLHRHARDVQFEQDSDRFYGPGGRAPLDPVTAGLYPEGE